MKFNTQLFKRYKGNFIFEHRIANRLNQSKNKLQIVLIVSVLLIILNIITFIL